MLSYFRGVKMLIRSQQTTKREYIAPPRKKIGQIRLAGGTIYPAEPKNQQIRGVQ